MEKILNFDEQRERMLQLRKRKIDSHNEGIPALHRLMAVAQQDTGQSRRVAAFLLSLYNDRRFTFSLTEFRGLDTEIFDDCINVLRMDANPNKEVHEYFDDFDLFERLAGQHGFTGASDNLELK